MFQLKNFKIKTTIMTDQIFIFIYTKKGKIYAMGIEKSKRLHKSLLSDGWTHTATIEAITYIQYLHDKCKESDIVKHVKSLSKK